MFRERRLNELIQYITENDEVSVTDLAKHFDVSTMTIRRDLARLDQSNLINRTHGGAIALNVLQSEEVYEKKFNQNYDVKQKIAAQALTLIINPANSGTPPKSVFLDAGTTNFQIAVQLKKYTGLKLFTNDLKIASELYAYPLDVYMTGGRVQPETGSVQGTSSNTFIESLNFEICFIGVSAVSPKLMLSTPSEEKALSKQIIMRQSQTKVLVCDNSKFNNVSLFNISSMASFDYVITDYDFTAAQLHLLESAGTVVLSV